MAELGAPSEHLDSWPIGPLVEAWADDPIRSVIVARIGERQVHAVEEAGRLYQAALDAWRARVGG